MNCVELFSEQVRRVPHKTALFVGQSWGRQEEISFQDLEREAIRAQIYLLHQGIRPGDSLLLLDTLSIRLYAYLIGILGLGCSAVLVEPWMPPSHIEKVIQLIQPQGFLSRGWGWIWGLRIPAIRKISRWIHTQKNHHTLHTQSFHLESVPASHPGIISFTSGTTGSPKGIVRAHGYLIQQNEVLSHHLGTHSLSGSDLCIFANFTLTNLAAGRTTLLTPPQWPKSFLRLLDSLPSSLQPASLTAGPAFLERLMKHVSLPTLKSIHIGGAQTDCETFEKGFSHWPDAHWSHIYGGSEVEPVACVDARVAVQKSRMRNLHQTLYLGTPVSEIQALIQPDELWVSGPHVCPEYLGNPAENYNIKKKDQEGKLWHNMTDRIDSDPEGWWYAGRSHQKREDFHLEQKVYSYLNSSRSFIYKNWLIGEGMKHREKPILKNFPQLSGVVEAQIYRDRRHRARIDRKQTLLKGASWLVG